MQALVKQQQRARQAEESSDEDVPEEFIDPIMMTPMTDPVLLPDSRTAVDRSLLLSISCSASMSWYTHLAVTHQELPLGTPEVDWTKAADGRGVNKGSPHALLATAPLLGRRSLIWRTSGSLRVLCPL